MCLKMSKEVKLTLEFWTLEALTHFAPPRMAGVTVFSLEL